MKSVTPIMKEDESADPPLGIVGNQELKTDEAKRIKHEYLN